MFVSQNYTFLVAEAMEPDLNIFDYAITPCSLTQNEDRICRIPPNLIWLNSKNYINTFTYQDALNKVKNNNLKFCNFIYSNGNAHPFRDQLFYEISKYKQVDALGRHLHNTDITETRNNPNWQQISVELKSGYKFTIAAENALFKGYVTEKLLTSFQAHTVPIYFGNPKIVEEYNPEAFINCHDYKNFDDLIARIKEIDENDELWAKIVSTPWQTEAQIQDFNNKVLNYNNFFQTLFMPNKDINDKVRRPIGTVVSWYYGWFFRRFENMNPIELKLRQIAQKILISVGLLDTVHNILKKLGLRKN